MSLKTKLISSISMFVLVLALLVVSVFALRQESFSLGGTISFEAKNVYAEITGTISGQEDGPTPLPKLEFSNNKTPDTSGWAKGALVFDPNASPIQIKIEINVKNLSGESSLFVKVEDLIGAVTNLTKSVMIGAEDQEGAYVEVLPLQSVDYVISLSPTDEGGSVTGEYNYLITLIDESETQDIEIQANPNMETLGSVSGGGTFGLGDTVTLVATSSDSNNTFLAWATSTDPNTMEILSTSATYSFELTMDSPRTYYALFNQTPSPSQTVGDLVYTFYNEAKLAEITGTDSSFQGGDFTIPSVVTSGENSYKTYSIGDDAFRDCTNLTSIIIPEGVTSIESHAFDGCSSLTSITIPEGVTSIGNGAFYSCGSLTSIKIPEGVTSIGNSAFNYCSSLTTISLPIGLTSIGEGAFFNCRSLEAFYGNGNSYYRIDGNRALIVDGGETLLAYAVANTETSYSIPEGVTSIGEGAFQDCSGLTSITIPEGVTSIGWNAFQDCSGLTSITIPEGVTSIDTGVFQSCSSLTSVILPSKLTSIGDYAFYNCSSLTSVTLPSKLTSIGTGAFQSCSSLTEITIPEGVTSIGYGAFQLCSSLTSITIPEGVTSIGNYAFDSCSGLTSITIPEGVTSIGSSAFDSCSSLTSITLPSILTSIGDNAFSRCSSLTEITIPEGVTSISDSAFSYCSSLTSISLPSILTSIGGSAFSGCSGLTSITIPEGVTSIGGSAFSGCSGLTEITIPEGVTSIGDHAFSYCYSLTQITINGDISTLGSSAFHYCTNLTKLTLGAKVTSIPSNLFTDNNLTRLTEIVVEEDSTLDENIALPTYAKWYKGDDPTEVTNFRGAGTYSTTQPTIITVEANQASLGSVSGGGAYAIGDTVTLVATSLDSKTFLGWATSLDPETMEIVSLSQKYSFDVSLDTPTTYYALFNQTTTPSQTVGDLVYTFYNEAGLAEITDAASSFPGGDYTIPSVVANGDNSYRVYSIGDYALAGAGMNSLIIPEGVVSIGDAAFDHCYLRSVSIPESVISFGHAPFTFCNLTYYTDSDNNKYLGNETNNYLVLADVADKTITEFDFPAGCKIICGAFSGCNNLTSITIPENITSIAGAFSSCSSLTSISLPSTLTSIGSQAFSNCSKLTSITIPEGVTSIGSSAFSYCYSLTSITIPEGVTTIEGGAFAYSGLTTLSLPSTLTSIASEGIFEGCVDLTTIVVEEGSTLSAPLQTYGTWVKDGGTETVTSFKGAGTYRRTDIQ